MGDGAGLCSVGLVQGSSKKIFLLVGRCGKFYQFKMGTAVKEKEKGKFITNVPVKGTVCVVDTYVWKYGVEAHFRGVHDGLAVPASVADTVISAKEKKSLGLRPNED